MLCFLRMGGGLEGRVHLHLYTSIKLIIYCTLSLRKKTFLFDLDPVLYSEHPQSGHVAPAGRPDRARRLHLCTQEGQTQGDRNL